MMQVEEAHLAGIGKRVTYKNVLSGDTIVVVARNDDVFELHINPDKIGKSISLKLAKDEAKSIGIFLGGLLSSPGVVDVLSHVITGDIAIDQISIKHGAKVVGKTISEIDLRKNTGASILSIIRQTQTITNPDPSEKILGGDVLITIGTSEQRDRARKILQS
ncbi:MAG: TrkA C-terminal domain-containing protein [Methanocellales archaeon]